MHVIKQMKYALRLGISLTHVIFFFHKKSHSNAGHALATINVFKIHAKISVVLTVLCLQFRRINNNAIVAESQDFDESHVLIVVSMATECYIEIV